MRKLIARGLLITGLAVTGPALAVNSSLSLKEAMTRFGLIGEWAAQCSLPPSGKNAHTHWSVSSDTAGELLTDLEVARR